jgi:hypothetical protein
MILRNLFDSRFNLLDKSIKKIDIIYFTYSLNCVKILPRQQLGDGIHGFSSCLEVRIVR